ncbi:MAG: AarF/ABC1/UbiB kinase family protein, partial [Anaerolineae bacterium]|nr:AarF/ABC1/UbiB kinase family protein [Anaerolineae bacterium]
DDLVRLYVVAIGLDSERIVEQLIRMGAAKLRVDRAGLKRDLERLLIKYHNLPLKEIQAREVVEEIMPIAFRHHLHLPSELWLLGKMLAMMEGVGLRLDPELDIFEVSRPYVRRFLWQMASPRVWGRKLAKGAGDWGELFALFPRQATRLLEQVERGELGLTLSLKETDRVVGKLDRIANRLVVSILLAALIMGMALLIPLVAGGGQGFVFWLVMAGFAAASFMGLGLLYSIWRAERRGR